jgi:hypothetical protein
MSPSALKIHLKSCYFTNVVEIYALCVRSATFLIFLIFGGCPLSSTVEIINLFLFQNPYPSCEWYWRWFI